MLAVLAHSLAGNLNRQSAAPWTTPRGFFHSHWSLFKLWAEHKGESTKHFPLIKFCGILFTALFTNMKWLLGLTVVFGASLLVSSAPPTCYSRVLSLGKEITESYINLKKSETVVRGFSFLKNAFLWQSFLYGGWNGECESLFSKKIYMSNALYFGYRSSVWRPCQGFIWIYTWVCCAACPSLWE